MRNRVGRCHDGGDDDDAQDGVAAHGGQELRAHHARQAEQGQDDRQLEAQAESDHQGFDKFEIFRHLGLEFDADTRRIDDLLVEGEPQDHGQDHEIDQAHAQDEEHGCRDQERQEGQAFAFVQARRDEAIKLEGKDWEADDHAAEHGNAQIGEEDFHRRSRLQHDILDVGDGFEAGQDQHQIERPGRVGGLLLMVQRRSDGQRMDHEVEDMVVEAVAADDADDEGHGHDDNTRTQFQQVVHQGGARGFDIGLVIVEGIEDRADQVAFRFVLDDLRSLRHDTVFLLAARLRGVTVGCGGRSIIGTVLRARGFFTTMSGASVMMAGGASSALRCGGRPSS